MRGAARQKDGEGKRRGTVGGGGDKGCCKAVRVP